LEQPEFLPALPRAWKNGYVKGLRIRGNRTIEMKWENGQVEYVKIEKQ
jgi:alpha-L-fucosidase 2